MQPQLPLWPRRARSRRVGVVSHPAMRESQPEREFAFQLQHSNIQHLPYVRDFRFAQLHGRRFEIDFAWLDARLGVEIQGGIWRRGGGAHSRPANLERDVEKAQAALRLSWRIVPVTPQQVKSGYALELIEELLRSAPNVALERAGRGRTPAIV